MSAIDIKLNNKVTTIVNIYDTDSKTTQSDYQKYSLKLITNLLFVEILMLIIIYGEVNEMIQRANICITMLSKII